MSITRTAPRKEKFVLMATVFAITAQSEEVVCKVMAIQ